MSIRKFEDSDDEMMEYARMYVDGMAARERYDPAKARSYYQRNREAILEMNKQYYANHRTEYVNYLRSYWSENREILNKRYKLHKLVKRISQEKDTRSEWAIERENFVKAVVPDIETVPPTLVCHNGSRKRKPRAKPAPKPYTFVIRNEPGVMTFD